jgi:hypothetical protein
MKNHHSNIGGIRGSPKFSAFFNARLLSATTCESGVSMSLFAGCGQTPPHGKIQVKPI